MKRYRCMAGFDSSGRLSILLYLNQLGLSPEQADYIPAERLREIERAHRYYPQTSTVLEYIYGLMRANPQRYGLTDVEPAPEADAEAPQQSAVQPAASTGLNEQRSGHLWVLLATAIFVGLLIAIVLGLFYRL